VGTKTIEFRGGKTVELDLRMPIALLMPGVPISRGLLAIALHIAGGHVVLGAWSSWKRDGRERGPVYRILFASDLPMIEHAFGAVAAEEAKQTFDEVARRPTLEDLAVPVLRAPTILPPPPVEPQQEVPRRPSKWSWSDLKSASDCEARVYALARIRSSRERSELLPAIEAVAGLELRLVLARSLLRLTGSPADNSAMIQDAMLSARHGSHPPPRPSGAADRLADAMRSTRPPMKKFGQATA
jgi:hypothetical protein